MLDDNSAATPASVSNLGMSTPSRPRGNLIPLSDNQQSYWSRLVGTQRRRLVQRLQAGAVRIVGPLDCGALEASMEAVSLRHESLRTTIVPDDQTAFQRVTERINHLSQLDLTTFSAQNAQREASIIARQFFERGMDVCTEPLFSSCLLKLSDTDHVFLVGLEHMIGDGASCGILMREIWAAYGQISRGLPLSLPQLLMQYPDYALWQKQTLEARRSKHEPYWSARMHGASYMRIPYGPGNERPERQASLLRNIPFGKVLTDGLRAVAHREKTLLPIVCLAAYVLAMARWCNQMDLSLLFASNGRYRNAQVQQMIGFLANALPFRIQMCPEDNLADTVKRVHSEFVSATEHQDFVPTVPDGLTPHAHLFNWGGMVGYSARWSVDQQRRSVPGIRIQPFRVGLESNYQFYPVFCDTPSGIVASIHHQEDFVDAASIDRLGRNMRIIAQELNARPLSRISALRLNS